MDTGSKRVEFANGKTMKNEFMLAPLTNCQSNEDGTLSDDEFNWLVKRAEGGFGLTMTCAAHVQKAGQGFPGQLGIFSDIHLGGHSKLASAIKDRGSLAVAQLHHAGMRSPAELIGHQPLCPSSDEETGSRALTNSEVRQLRDDFVQAAQLAKKAGYDGVEVHGAHGYVVCQFLSELYNRREDEYGGSLENRQRLLVEIVDGINESCGDDFLLGVRLSPERFGIRLAEAIDTCKVMIDSGKVHFLDISLWDSFKLPAEEDHQGKSLLAHFADVDRKNVKLTVAGKITNAMEVAEVLNSNIDFVTIGRSAILHHDFANRVIADETFEPIVTPVTPEHLAEEGLSPTFIQYMGNWKGFVSTTEAG